MNGAWRLQALLPHALTPGLAAHAGTELGRAGEEEHEGTLLALKGRLKDMPLPSQIQTFVAFA